MNKDIINEAMKKLEVFEVEEFGKMLKAFEEYKLEVSKLSDITDAYEQTAKKLSEQLSHIKYLSGAEPQGIEFASSETYKFISEL